MTLYSPVNCKKRWTSYSLTRSRRVMSAKPSSGRLLALADIEYIAQAADLASTSRVLVAVVSILHKRGEWALLNSHLSLLSKKHGQLRQATQKMVEEVMTYLDTAEGRTKLDLIETLREVTEGKVQFCPA